MSVEHAPASPSNECSWKTAELETQTSHNIVEKAHKDKRMKSVRQETLREACVQFKAMKTEKSK